MRDDSAGVREDEFFLRKVKVIMEMVVVEWWSCKER